MRALLLLLLLWAETGLAHEVHHTIESAGAVVFRLDYADGKPFSYEAYELYPAGKDVPAQVGRTDAEGRVVFLPGETRQWRIRAFSADGHGVDMRFESPAVASQPTAATVGFNRSSLILSGLSLLLGGFGLYQLFLRNRKSP